MHRADTETCLDMSERGGEDRTISETGRRGGPGREWGGGPGSGGHQTWGHPHRSWENSELTLFY